MVAYETTSPAHQLIPILSPNVTSQFLSGLMLISSSPLKPSWSNGLIAHYSGGVDLMSGISYHLDLVDLPCGGGFINPVFALFFSPPPPPSLFFCLVYEATEQ